MHLVLPDNSGTGKELCQCSRQYIARHVVPARSCVSTAGCAMLE